MYSLRGNERYKRLMIKQNLPVIPDSEHTCLSHHIPQVSSIERIRELQTG